MSVSETDVFDFVQTQGPITLVAKLTFGAPPDPSRLGFGWIGRIRPDLESFSANSADNHQNPLRFRSDPPGI